MKRGDLIKIERKYLGSRSTFVLGVVIDSNLCSLPEDFNAQVHTVRTHKITLLKFGGKLTSFYLYNNDALEVICSNRPT